MAYDAVYETTSPLRETRQEQTKADVIVEPNSVNNTTKPSEAVLLNEASTQTEIDDQSKTFSLPSAYLPTDKVSVSLINETG